MIHKMIDKMRNYMVTQFDKNTSSPAGFLLRISIIMVILGISLFSSCVPGDHGIPDSYLGNLYPSESGKWIGSSGYPWAGFVGKGVYVWNGSSYIIQTGQGLSRRNNASQNITLGTYAQLVFQSNIYDTGAFTTSANSTSFTCLIPGLYQLNLGLEISGVTSNQTFYPDYHPEVVSVDGYTGHDLASEPWGTVHDGAGSVASDTATQAFASYEYSGADGTHWYAIYRSVLLFDTSPLVDTVIISAATLRVRGSIKNDNIAITPSVNVYSSNPMSNTSLTSTDYNFTGWGTTAFSSSIAYNDWAINGNWNTFNLNSNGLAAISKTSISKFGFRDNYDVTNTKPTTANYYKGTTLNFWTSENTTSRPELIVTWGATQNKIVLIKVNGNVVGNFLQPADNVNIGSMFALNAGDVVTAEIYCAASNLTVNKTDYYSAYLSMARVGM